MIWTFPDIRISSEICSDILQKSILMAERPYRRAAMKCGAAMIAMNLARLNVIDNANAAHRKVIGNLINVCPSVRTSLTVSRRLDESRKALLSNNSARWGNLSNNAASIKRGLNTQEIFLLTLEPCRVNLTRARSIRWKEIKDEMERPCRENGKSLFD